MTTPAITSEMRARAPASTLSAVADIDPPTGIPWKTPAATFAAPWPRKSREASG